MTDQQPPKTKSVVRAAASASTKDAKNRDKAAKKSTTMDSFVNFAQNMGFGADNALATSSYGFNPVTRNRVLLEWIHRGSWLGGVAVDVVADDMTRAGISIKGKVDPESLARIESTASKLNIWNAINDTIKWSRLYGGALAVLLIEGQDLSTPLRLKTIKKDQFKGLLTLDRWMVEPSLSDLVTDYGPEMGLPKYYRVNMGAPALSGMKIHHSRCIRLEGIRLPYQQRLIENLWGLSILERLYDRMIAFDSASTGAAQLVYKSYLRTFKVKDMREIVAAGGAASAGLTRYVDMMRRFQGVEGITLIDSEDEFGTETHSAFGGLSEALAQFGQQISGALQIPLVRLFGQSPAGFSTGDSDVRNYYDTIKQQQEKDLRLGVTKVYRALAASEDIPFEDTEIEFNPLWQLTDPEKAGIAQTVAQTISSTEESGIIDRATALKELHQSSQITGIFTNITPEMIDEAEQEGPPIPEDVEVAMVRKEGTDPNLEQPKLPKTTDSLSDKIKALVGATAQRSKNAAGILFVVENSDNVLLIRRGPDGDYPGTWSVPAGHIEPGELPEQAARRETFEEVGFYYAGELKELYHKDNFTMFVAILKAPFEVKLNHESTDYIWTDSHINLHPGLVGIVPEPKL